MQILMQLSVIVALLAVALAQNVTVSFTAINPSTSPSARDLHCAVSNGATLFVFGGSAKAMALNSVWAYDYIGTGWNLLSGSDTTQAFPVFGTKGQESSTTNPGSIFAHSCVYSSSTNRIYVMGGSTQLSSGTTSSTTNSVWSFNTGTSQWAFRSGRSSNANALGPLGNFSADSMPMSRQNLALAINSVGTILYMFGGQQSSTSGGINDLWRYSVGLDLWSYERVDSSIYGFQNSDPTVNQPPPSYGNKIVLVESSNLIFNFGGQFTSTTFFDDLMYYDISSRLWTWISGSKGSTGTPKYNITGKFNNFNIPGSRACVGMSYIPSQSVILMYAGMGIGASGSSSEFIFTKSLF